jgi:hypothetical protein
MQVFSLPFQLVTLVIPVIHSTNIYLELDIWHFVPGRSTGDNPPSFSLMFPLFFAMLQSLYISLIDYCMYHLLDFHQRSTCILEFNAQNHHLVLNWATSKTCWCSGYAHLRSHGSC